MTEVGHKPVWCDDWFFFCYGSNFCSGINDYKATVKNRIIWSSLLVEGSSGFHRKCSD